MLAITWGSFVNSTTLILSWLKLLFTSRSAKGTFPPKRRCSPSSPAACGPQAVLGAAIHEVCVWGTAWDSREDVLSGRLLVQRRGLISGRGLVHVSPRQQQLLPAPRSGRAGLCESLPEPSPCAIAVPLSLSPLGSVRKAVPAPPGPGVGWCWWAAGPAGLSQVRCPPVSWACRHLPFLLPGSFSFRRMPWTGSQKIFF